jgi:hypothetical protein
LNRDSSGRIPFILAVALTVAWLGLGIAYIVHAGSTVAAMAPPQLAAVLAAIALPPLVLWLIVTVLEQRGALAQLMAQSRQNLHQTEAQARALLQLQAEAARDRGAEARALAFHDLAANAAILAERLGVLGKEGAVAAWARYGAGDVTVFVQAFLTFSLSHPDIAERMAEAVVRDGVARAALAAYVRRYQRLTSALADDKMTLEILDEGALGRAFMMFKQADELALGAAAAAQAMPARADTPVASES